jgi:hypothetical protein
MIIKDKKIALFHMPNPYSDFVQGLLFKKFCAKSLNGFDWSKFYEQFKHLECFKGLESLNKKDLNKFVKNYFFKKAIFNNFFDENSINTFKIKLLPSQDNEEFIALDNSYFSLGVVCNPYVYAIHCYKTLNQEFGIDESFSDFLNRSGVYANLLNGVSTHKKVLPYFSTQSYYIADANGNCNVTYLINSTHFEDDLQFLSKILKISIMEEELENISMTPYITSDYYTKSKDWDLVRINYSKDFKLLGFKP